GQGGRRRDTATTQNSSQSGLARLAGFGARERALPPYAARWTQSGSAPPAGAPPGKPRWVARRYAVGELQLEPLGRDAPDGGRHGRRLTERGGILQPGLERRDGDARFDGEQIDADEANTHPGIDHDALVEHAIEDVDQAARRWPPLDVHRALLKASCKFR